MRRPNARSSPSSIADPRASRSVRASHAFRGPSQRARIRCSSPPLQDRRSRPWMRAVRWICARRTRRHTSIDVSRNATSARISSRSILRANRSKHGQPTHERCLTGLIRHTRRTVGVVLDDGRSLDEKRVEPRNSRRFLITRIDGDEGALLLGQPELRAASVGSAGARRSITRDDVQNSRTASRSADKSTAVMKAGRRRAALDGAAEGQAVLDLRLSERDATSRCRRAQGRRTARDIARSRERASSHRASRAQRIPMKAGLKWRR